ncbi:MAG: pectate lyase [Deltaproteobacteria bacterium]|nr:pectate lyase [Deltaproteobacteria bacterium]
MNNRFFKLLVVLELSIFGCSDSSQHSSGSSGNQANGGTNTAGQLAQGGSSSGDAGSVTGGTTAGSGTAQANGGANTSQDGSSSGDTGSVTGGTTAGNGTSEGGATGGSGPTAGVVSTGGTLTESGGSTAGAAASAGSSGTSGISASNRPMGFASVSALGIENTTGGAGGKLVNADTAEALLAYMDSEEALIIMISGTIDLEGMVPLRSNKTLIGLSNARLINGGLELYKRQNIIIRNIAFADGTDDTMKINQNTHHVWVDHCDFSNSADGLFDITRQSSYITISWNHFYNHSKTMLIGHSDSESEDAGHLKTTIHNNWFDGTEQRHPRVRFGEVHVFNNYFLNNRLYGVASTMEADVVMEGNYFDNVPYPSYSGYQESGPGDLVERNNVYHKSGSPQIRGTAFDPQTYYDYVVDDPELVPDFIRNGAGVGVIDPVAASG